MLSCSLDLLGDLRPDRVREQLDRLDGLGAPALRLCVLQHELSSSSSDQPTTPVPTPTRPV